MSSEQMGSVTPGLLPIPQNDPVAQAVLDNVMGKFPVNKQPKPMVTMRCDLCDIEFNSKVPLDMHLKGAKHAKKVKTKEILAVAKDDQGETGKQTGKWLQCEICSVTVNSSHQLSLHIEGVKHKTRCRKLRINCNQTTMSAVATLEDSNLQHNGSSVKVSSGTYDQPPPSKIKKFSCDVCHVSVNSETQLQQHLASKKHQAQLEGKPLASKSSWWNKKKQQDGSQVGSGLIFQDSQCAFGNEGASYNQQPVYSEPLLQHSFVSGGILY